MDGSRTSTLLDDHVVEDADNSTTVEVVGERQGAEPRRRARRPRDRQTADGRRRPDEFADRGVVVRRPVSGRTRAVAVVRLVAFRRKYPVVPADLTERDPERPATAARLVAAGRTQLVDRGRQRHVWKHRASCPPMNCRPTMSAASLIHTTYWTTDQQTSQSQSNCKLSIQQEQFRDAQ